MKVELKEVTIRDISRGYKSNDEECVMDHGCTLNDIFEFYQKYNNGSMSPYWTKALITRLSPVFYVIFKDNDIIALGATTTNYQALVDYWEETRPHIDDFPEQEKNDILLF